MQAKYYGLAAVALVALLVLAATFELPQERPEESETETAPDCREHSMRTARDACWTARARTLEDAGTCERVEAPSMQDNCYMQVAVVTRNISLCARAGKRERCLQQMAFNMSDPAPCEQIRDAAGRDACFRQVAEKTGEKELCERIESQDERDRCYYLLGKQDMQLCSKIVDRDMREQCMSG